MGQQLHRFFAITENVIYVISDIRNRDGVPTVKIVHEIGPNSSPFKERLTGGKIVNITGRHGIVLSSGSKNIGVDEKEVNQANWGDHTSLVSALTITEEDMERILQDNGNKIFCPWDDRWIPQTQEVLRRIGDTHPIFRISWLCMPDEVMYHLDVV